MFKFVFYITMLLSPDNELQIRQTVIYETQDMKSCTENFLMAMTHVQNLEKTGTVQLLEWEECKEEIET